MMNARSLTFALCLLAVTVDADYASDETNLINLLKTNYNTDARPYNSTQVLCQLVPFALNSVDIETETMALTGVIISEWSDPRLVWDQATNGINEVVIKPGNIWTPPLLVENEISRIGILGSEGAPLRVSSDGTVRWSPPVSTKTSCSADITYYPYDKQTCTVTVVGYSYSTEEVLVSTDLADPIVTQFLDQNGEWDLLQTSGKYNHIGDGMRIYRKINFDIVLRRKWAYYTQNIILPIVLNSVLMAMVFAVPIESGEKMGYCLTVQLSYVVLLTMVSADLPSISNQTSIIQMYLSIVLCIGTACIVCTTYVLRIYNRDESESVQGCLQTLTRYILAPLVCTSCSRKRRKKISPEISNSEKAPAWAASEEHRETYSCKEIAKILDKFFFLIFTLVLIFMTGTFIGLLLFNYQNA